MGAMITGLFQRLIQIGVGTELAKNILALWSWLESKGLDNVMTRINSYDQDDYFFSSVVSEAQGALASLQASSLEPISSTIRMRATLNVAGNASFPLEHLLKDRERALGGINSFVNDELSRGIDECVREQGGVKAGLMEPNPGEGKKRSKMNPFAKEWRPPTDEEDRCLYITFSNGFPLQPLQIYYYFTLKYGLCLERIHVHQPSDGGPPQFGRLVFRTSLIPWLVLNGRQEARLCIDGRSMWCKKYKLKRKDGSV